MVTISSVKSGRVFTVPVTHASNYQVSESEWTHGAVTTLMVLECIVKCAMDVWIEGDFSMGSDFLSLRQGARLAVSLSGGRQAFLYALALVPRFLQFMQGYLYYR